MTQEPLTRIGSAPQSPKRKTRQKPWLIWVPVAVIALGLAAALGGFLVAGGPEPIRKLLGISVETPPAAAVPTEVQIECANIKHAYVIWSRKRTDFDSLPRLAPEVANFEAKRLSEEGKKFLDAATGHKDQPSKVLATAIAGYNVELGFVGLELQIAGSFNPNAYEKAKTAWRSVETAYESYLALTCASAP